MLYSTILALGIVLVLLQFFFNAYAISLTWGAFQPLYQNDPVALQPKFQQICDISADPTVCAAAKDPMGFAEQGTNYQYNQQLCILSIVSQPAYSNIYAAEVPVWERNTAAFRCSRLSTYWVDSMEWLRDNADDDAVVISWWDYGHWINFFGQRNTVLRNEHASHEMIGAVADSYLDATPEELKEYMLAHNSKYALFDIELVMSGGGFGGKYGALNYLSCAWNNETNVSFSPGQSQCEGDHLWEVIFISSNPCTISSLSGTQGFTAYKFYELDRYLPYYPGDCIDPQNQNVVAYCQNIIRAEPVYCVGNATLALGQTITTTYYLNETTPTGDLKLNKASLQFPYQIDTPHLGRVTSATLLYTNDPVWMENGAMTSGFSDRKGKFYDSTLYQALFLNYLPGFQQVYSSPEGAVKIYKINE